MVGFSWMLLQVLFSASAMAQEITILGWSADERYFAVRTIEKIATDEEIEANQEGELQDLGPDAGLVGFCPEYVDPISKRPFRGNLKISIYQIVSADNKQPKVQLASEPFIIYKEGTRGSEHASCTPHKEAQKRLLTAKKVMSKKGIVLGSTAHYPLQFVQQQRSETIHLNNSTSYLITDWNDANAEEVSSQGHYDEEPVRVDISLDKFVDQYGTENILMGHVYVLRENGEESYGVKDAVQGKNLKHRPDQLMNGLSVSSSYRTEFAGDGGIDLMGVYASPSKRIVVFAISVWDFNYYTLRSDAYQFPLAIERWQID